jgi:hypothetical protein
MSATRHSSTPARTTGSHSERKDGGTMKVNPIVGRRLRPALTAGVAAAVVAVGLLAGSGSALAGVRQAPLGGRLPSTLPALSTAAPVTPAGPVTGSGCTGSGAAVACHVYAVAGSVTLPGLLSPVPTWKFQADPAVPTAGQQTGTGPVLVVTSGATVTLTLDNVNVPDAVSLAVPGLSGLAGPAAGVAAGGSSTYTFTAGRPGTYLYEAGHTANGARQVLMGLVGALVVRPADWTGAAPGTTDLGASSVPASGFDDEAVLVLGDLDPAFAAHPLTYDLRLFKGTYRTINGKVYPSTDQIPTATGHSVLLRYLNAGAVNHSMGVQGLPESVLTTDSYPTNGTKLVADMLAPGQTEDVTVTLPSEGNFVVADDSGQLDSAGLTDGSSGLAFGGMMTLLGTNVTPVTTDTVGPTSTITAVTPNPAKVTTPVTVTTSFADPTVDAGPHDVTAAELLIDGDVSTLAPGSGTAFTPVSTGSGTATGSITLTSAMLTTLTQGKHRLYVRAQDSLGNWGPVTSALLNLAVTGATTSSGSATPNPTNGKVDVGIAGTGDDSGLGGTVDDARFAVDCDPATSSTCVTTALVLESPGSGTTALTGTLTAVGVQALGQGSHTVYLQSHDSEGFWGPTAPVTLVVDTTAPAATSLLVSPATNDGTVADPIDPTSFRISGTFSDLGAPASKVVAAEGWFPPVVGGTQAPPTSANDGTGLVFQASDGAFSSTVESAYGLVPLSQLTAYPDGTYQVWMHAKDAAGNWGTWTPTSFTVKRGLFADGFESATLGAWTGGTTPTPPGTRLVVTNATGAHSAGSYGLAVSGSGTTQATVQTPAVSPAAATYHARFAFNPNGLRTTGTTGLTGILTGLSGTTQAFQVQYHRASLTAPAQVRLYFSATKVTPWVTVGSTSWSSIQVDWSAGKKATLTLTVNGAVSTITAVANSAQRISAAQLGFRGAVGSLTGTAYFDAFVSALTPLP